METSPTPHRFNTPKLAAGDERGQTIVEYALILLFVSTALVLTLTGFASDLKGLFEMGIGAF